MIKILVVDDQTLMRDGLKTILDLEEDLEVVGTACNGREAYKLVKQVEPDVILMDIRMPILNGVEATKLIKEEFKDISIIILTTFDTDDMIIEALACGADGYILKDIDGDRLIQSIKDCFNGDMILPAKIAAKLVTRVLKTQKVITENEMDLNSFQITEREKEICDLLCAGYTNKQICNKLFLTIGTVKNYVTSIYNKLGVSNRISAILFLKKM
ncbi:MAG: response regulator transcription factor [Clostridium sp.]